MVGATGAFAGLVLTELVGRGVTVRALVRDAAGVAKAAARGAAETALGDLGDPASLRRAADGVDGVFHINPALAPDEAGMGVAMVAAARDAGVGKLVFSGVMHPSIASMVNHDAKRPVEEAVYGSGLDYTVLQPAMFMQMLGGAVAGARRDGTVSGPYSNTSKMSYVDYRDVAEAAALAMTGPSLSRGTFELCGAGMYSRHDLAALLAEELGRPVRAVVSVVEEWPPDRLGEGLARMTDHYDRYGFPGGNALVLRAVLGREPRSVRDFVREQVSDD